MSAFQPIHPRRLYTTLLASKTRHERAQATLDFLCNCVGSQRGYLFLHAGAGLEVAASKGQDAPPSDLVAEAEHAWVNEFEQAPDDNRTRTVDLSLRRKVDAPVEEALWSSSLGIAYARRVLGAYVQARWVPVGIVLLESPAELSPLRQSYIESICNAFIQAGDVPGASEQSSSPAS
jgi:hypothetical protein